MKSNYKRLGDYIVPCDVLNDDLSLSLLQGISNEKYFQNCKSNTVDIDLSRYRVCKKGWFAYNRATTRNGDKISIAYREEEDCLVSPSYKCFKISNEQQLLPYYLLLWFKRPEFDRYARFMSHGSAHEYFEYDQLCEVELPVPPIKEQEKIVDAYQKIENRIALKKKINENLEKQAFAIYKFYAAEFDKETMLSDIAIITMGTSPDGDSFNVDGEGDVFYQGRSDFGFRFPTIRLYTTDGKRYAKKGDVLMSVRAPVGDVNIAKENCAIGRGLAAIRSKQDYPSFLYYTMRELHFELNRYNDDGTVFGSITKEDLYALNVPSFSVQVMAQFENAVKPIDDSIRKNEFEIFKLIEIKVLLLSQLTL